jgi:hypothetical protein
MKHNLEHTTALLSRTPAALNALLRDLPDTWTLKNEGEETWRAHRLDAAREDDYGIRRGTGF